MRPSTPSLVDDLLAVRSWSYRPPGVELAEVDDALMIIGDAVNAISTGIQGCWSFDFMARITGWFIQEFDGLGSGSVTLDLQAAPRGLTPTFASIVASAHPTVASARYNESATLTGWTTQINRGDLLRLHVTALTSFKRLLIGIRIRRLEP